MENLSYLININEHEKSYGKNMLFKTSEGADYKRVIYKPHNHYIVNEDNIIFNQQIQTNQNSTHFNINVNIKLSLDADLDKNEFYKLAKNFKNIDQETSIPKYFQVLFLSYDGISELNTMDKINDINILNLKANIIEQKCKADCSFSRSPVAYYKGNIIFKKENIINAITIPIDLNSEYPYNQGFKKYGLECDNHQSLSVCYDYQNIYYTVYKPMEAKRVYSDEIYNSNELIPEKKENNVIMTIDYLLKFILGEENDKTN